MTVRIRVASRPAVFFLAMAGRLPLRPIARILGAAALILYGHSTNFAETYFHPAPDPRFDRLERFFHRYGCQAPHHIGDYLRAADRHGLDYRLLPALSIRETHCGLAERHNNHWGYHPGRQTFPSLEAGIEFLAQQLAENPPYRGKSLQQKLFTYNPRTAYPGEVKRIMRQIESAPLDRAVLGPGAKLLGISSKGMYPKKQARRALKKSAHNRLAGRDPARRVSPAFDAAPGGPRAVR